MNIKEKEQIELLSKVIGRRINHENDSYIATRIWDGCCTYLSANRQLFSTFKNGIPEYHVEEAIKVVIMYINDRHKTCFLSRRLTHRRSLHRKSKHLSCKIIYYI